MEAQSGGETGAKSEQAGGRARVEPSRTSSAPELWGRTANTEWGARLTVIQQGQDKGAVATNSTHTLVPTGSPGPSLLVQLAPGQPDLLRTLKRS